MVDNLSGVQVLVALLVLIAGPGGAAFVAVKVGLNGARQDIRDTKATCEHMDHKLGVHGERLARVETRLDGIERHPRGGRPADSEP